VSSSRLEVSIATLKKSFSPAAATATSPGGTSASATMKWEMRGLAFLTSRSEKVTVLSPSRQSGVGTLSRMA